MENIADVSSLIRLRIINIGHRMIIQAAVLQSDLIPFTGWCQMNMFGVR